MSEAEQAAEEQLKDNFTVIEKNTNRYFAEIENSVPHYQQTLFDLQNEYFKAWKNAVNTNISLQKEFANKTGFNLILPETTQTIIEHMTEGFAKVRSTRDKIIITSVEATKKNVIMWNDNANSFADLNRNIMKYWISLFASK